jgi:hypothetical protein
VSGSPRAAPGASSISAALVRAAERKEWRDPMTGYTRRPVPCWPDGPAELTEICLPPGANVVFPAAAYAFKRHVIWVIDGELDFQEGGTRHHLGPGDILRLGEAKDCASANHGAKTVRYAVLTKGQRKV